MKVGTCVGIESDLKALAKVRNINISEITNNALKAILLTDSSNGQKQMIILEQEIKELQEEIVEKQTELDYKKTTLSGLKEKSKQETLKDRETSEKFASAMKNSGILGDILE